MKPKDLAKSLIFIVVLSWFLSGWPQVWQKPPIPPKMEKARASPAEALTNGSFTGGTTGWTLSVSTYDSTTYQAGPGSVTTVTAAGRNKAATGTTTHNSAISTNATDTVTLSFYWKKNYVAATPVTNTISVQIQTSGGDWSAPTTLWTDTTTGATDWTYVSQDVSSNFGTGNYDFRFYMDLKNPNSSNAQTLGWFDTVSLDVVAAPIVSVSVSDGVVSYGIIPANTSKSTLSGELNDMQTATNDGDVTETFNIKGQNTACPWTLVSTAGNDQYVHQFCNDTANDCSSPPTNYTALTTSYQTLATGIAQSGTVDFQLRITVPGLSSCFASQSVDVTIQAVQE